ncbi:MAG: hypothetical protein V5A68_02965 [Candidatus Thermoplasmatota archaeon]
MSEHLDKPKSLYFLGLLWITLCGIFVVWDFISLNLSLAVLSWPPTEFSSIYSLLFFGTTMSAITWPVFACVFIWIAYGTFKGKSWVWYPGVIISTTFLVIFGLMLPAFMVTAIFFMDLFSVAGLITTVISFLIDLALIFLLTRPQVKIYLDIKSESFK